MILEFAARMLPPRCVSLGHYCWPVTILLMSLLPLVSGVEANAQTGPDASSGQAGTTAGPNWLFSPFVSVEGVYTDNVALSANKKSDFITQLSPGFSLEGKSARASANLNYQWRRYDYLDNSSLGNLQRSLAAKGKLELLDDWLFLEGSHNISQQSVSAFGAQSSGNELNNTNRTETSAYSISPYIQGRLVNAVDYLLRYTGTRTRSDSGALSTGTAAKTGAWAGTLSGATPLALLNWTFNVARQDVQHTNGVDSSSNNALGTLIYKIDPQVRLSVRAGRESDNFTSMERQTRTTSGLGLDWAPTERTNLSLNKDRNAVGNGHSIDFTHRTALTAWKFSDSRTLVIPTPSMAQVQTGTAFDLVFRQLESSFPDPALRAALANRLLAESGIPADSPIFIPVMTSQAYIQRRQQASVGLMGVNNTVIFAVDRSENQRMGSGIGLADDFALTSDIRQTGFRTSWAHKITPDSALTLSAGTSRSSSSTTLDSSNRTWSLIFTTRLGAKTSASIGLRQNHFSGSTSAGYDEQALTGAMKMKF